VNHRAQTTIVLGLLCGSFLLQAITGWTAAAEAKPLQFWIWLSSLILLATTITWWLHSQTAAQRVMQARLDAAAKAQLCSSADQARFIDDLAHEIKTPLTVVMNRAEILLRCSQDANAVRTHAKELADYTLNCAHLVDAFLRLAGPAPVPSAEQHAGVHIYDLVIETVRRLQPNARSRGVSIIINFAEPEATRNIPGGATVEVLGDERLLLAMLEHMLRHAVRSAPRNTQLTLQVDVPDERVIVHAHSSARTPLPTAHPAGADACDLVSESAAESPGNVSIDICRRIAAHHGGELQQPATPGNNFDFAVTLPRWRDVSSLLAAPAAAAPEMPPDDAIHASKRCAVKGTP
jgi:K+-sensing histidine kinase KdpD